MEQRRPGARRFKRLPFVRCDRILTWSERRARRVAALLLGACWVLSEAPARAEVYLTKDQALDAVFGDDCAPQHDPRPISDALRARLRALNLQGEAREQAHFFVCTLPDGKRKFALIDSEIGKHLPITYIVGLNHDGTVSRVEMMVFREIRGWEARERRFMRQFENKNVNDELSVGGSLGNVTGATLSSQAIARGVRRALLLWGEFYGPGRSG